MQQFLFPITRKGTKTPCLTFIREVLPRAQKAVMAIDPAPSRTLIAALEGIPQNIKRRAIVKFRMRSGCEDAAAELLVSRESEHLLKAGYSVRTLDDLSMRVYIVDDLAFIMSGTDEEGRSYAILLDVTDSQPVLDYCEELWRQSSKLTATRLSDYQTNFGQRLMQGQIPKSVLIEMINRRGAVIDVHARLFKGYHRRIIKVFPEYDEKRKGFNIAFNLVHSRHLLAFRREVGRIYQMKSKSLILDTPAGPFLPQKHQSRWEWDFKKRTMDLLDAARTYVLREYDAIRLEAESEIRMRLEELARTIDSKIFPDFFETKNERLGELFDQMTSSFPSPDLLIGSCMAWYVRLAIHPDSINNEDLFKIITQVSHQIELL